MLTAGRSRADKQPQPGRSWAAGTLPAGRPSDSLVAGRPPGRPAAGTSDSLQPGRPWARRP